MAYKVANSTLNASTIDILNVIRQNASTEYQSLIPEIETATDIPKVGEVIYGTPALANQFLNALINRIALVAVQSATFYNPYADLKKGYLEFGETVEEIFVNIAKVIDDNPEKAEGREFKRYLPDVQSAFHVINWRVLYPVTIQDNELQRAFLSMEGVQELIAKIVDSIYQAVEYDEFLLFKYLIIKSISSGGMKPISIGSGADLTEAAVQFRGISNLLTFRSNEYNEKGVATTTPKDRQVIFMDSLFNAQFDVEVLASAFNMGKADFMGRLYLIDNFTTFDNERFEYIRSQSDGLSEVTADELALLADVKAIILDEKWFQVYDNNNKFTEKYVASGLYWNYFFHTWKTVSYSPFSNAVCFVTSDADISLPDSITVEITDKEITEEATIFTLTPDFEGASLTPQSVLFVQTSTATSNAIAIQKYGAIVIPASASAVELVLELTVNGVSYTATTSISSANSVGATVEFTQTVTA